MVAVGVLVFSFCLIALKTAVLTGLNILINWVLHKCGMFFECRDVPWNVSTRVLDLCKIIFIPKISNAINCYAATVTTSLRS